MVVENGGNYSDYSWNGNGNEGGVEETPVAIFESL